MTQDNSLHSAGRRSAKILTRRNMLVSGTIAGVAGALGLSAIAPSPSEASSSGNRRNDIGILNGALRYEHQAIWAYNFAAPKLTSTSVGQAVLALAVRNRDDHMAHRDALSAAITSLGGTPVMTESSYDVSSYINNREGNVDSDVNIAKLALALETDAAIAYATEVAKLKTPALISAGASIGSTESAHAAAIRAAFVSLGVNIPVVPASFVNADNRSLWILKV